MNAFVPLSDARDAASLVYSGSTFIPEGWTLDTTFGIGGSGQVTGSSGGYAYALRPVIDDGRRMLVFRGTEPTLATLNDLFADVTDIGKTQFAELRNIVNPWLARQLVDGNRVELVGHSSGGALVQWAINDTNMRDENADNDQTLMSVLEVAKQLDENFVLAPAQLHFTTFNAPGITHLLGGTTSATDRTSIVVGEHHVVIGHPPLIQGDLVHLLGGPHVGGFGTQVLGHQVEFAGYRDGLFAHTIANADYWTAPVVSYTPPYLDLAMAQSFARHYAQLGNTDGTVEGDAEAAFRLTLYITSLGTALGVGVFAKQAEAATQLAGLQFDRDVFANTLALPGDGINRALDMITQAAEAAGQDVVYLQQLVSSALISVVERIQGAVEGVHTFIQDRLVPWFTDVAHGISNAVSEFLHDVPGTLFNLGRTLNFNDLNPFTNSYASALNDPGLPSSLKAALEDARRIVQRAGQAVVIQSGVGLNPFDTPGFNPEAAPPVTLTVGESLFQMLSIYLPFAAGAGGQRIQLKLTGPGASSFTLLTPDGEVTQDNGGFSVMVGEGLRHLTVKLRSNENVTSPNTLSLSAVLLDESGQETHQEQVEGMVTLSNSGDLPTGDLPTINYFNGQQSVTWVGDNDDNEPVFNAGANHVVFGNGGYDVLDLSKSAALFNHQVSGGIGNDAVHGGEGKDRLYGDEGFDFVTGGGGDDVLYGGDTSDRLVGDSLFFPLSVPGDDYVEGGFGDDLLEGQAGKDTLYGGIGNDLLLGDDSLIYANRPAGNDYLDGGDGNDYLFAGLGDDILYGGAGDDVLRGDNKLDEEQLVFSRVPGGMVFSSTGGPKFFTLDGGKDYLDGGDGVDILVGEGGADILIGGAGDDELYGDEDDADPDVNGGNDWLEGGEGNDALYGGDGEDALFGGEGDDTLWGDYGNRDGFADYLEGGAGNDLLGGAQGDDILVGGDGIDLLLGHEGDDVLDGGAESDELGGGLGDDVLDGGADDDIIHANEGNDEVVGGSGNDLIFGEDGEDILDGEDGADELQGGAGSDFVAGGSGDDLLFGNDDDDTVLGEAGNDELQGNLGHDVLTGGEGSDTVFGQEDDDTLFGEGGNDTMWGGLDNDVLDGGAGDDALVGDDTDLVGGFGGTDVLTGGAGNDYLGGGGGGDTYLFNPGDGFDVIRDFAGEGNRLVFGAGIHAGALIVAATLNDSLVIRTGGGDAVEILNFGTANPTGLHPIDIFEFSDGTILTYAQLVADGLGISGGFGADMLSGGTEGERIFGGAGNDTILALDGADRLLGEDGADRLEGGSGDDVLSGGKGDDILIGGAGLDTYTFRTGWGVEQIQDAAGEGNRLVFGAGIVQGNLTLGFRRATISSGGGEGEIGGEEGGGNTGTVLNYLVVRTGGTGDAVEIQWFDPANQLASLGVDQFVFADGTTLTSSQLLAEGLELVGTAEFDSLDGQDIYRRIRGLAGDDQLTGGSIDNVIDGGDGRDVLIGNGGIDQLFGSIGDDVLRGGDGNDVLNGGVGTDALEGEAGDDVLIGNIGDDQLLGGTGNDTYQFNIGDGRDSITDFSPSSDTDRVVFGTGITSSALSLTADFGQILVTVGTGSEGIYVGNSGDIFGSQTIELFQFADGTSLSFADLVARGFDIRGTEFDDVLFGTNLADRFHGGLGHDRLEGHEGNDSYFFAIGDGVDTIVDVASPGAGNEILFGVGITSTDLQLDLVPDQSDSDKHNLFIRIGSAGDAIQLDRFEHENVLGVRTVETFRFADGSLLTYDQLLARGFDRMGTTGDDQLTGTNTTDRMVGMDGADILRAGAGDDQLDGGAGHDRLMGGDGNDIYLFGPGAGHDTIVEFQGTLDAIRMASGVTPRDVVVTRHNNDLVLSLNGGADRLTVSLYFLAPSLQIESVQFADGTVWDRGVIENFIRPVITGTDGPDALVGTASDDRLAGLAGDDQLTGLAGDDLLDGGSGSDQLAGNAGDDTYVVDSSDDVVSETLNEGRDTVRATASYQLSDNVEHLMLTGNAPIDGTGNELNNVLTGNSASNVLTGLAGDDTYVVGVGDTVVELAGEGIDTVETSVSATLGANLEQLTLRGSASLTGIGNSLDNVLKADGSISVLSGGDGNDTYVIGFNSDDDILVEAVTGGIDTVIAGHDYRLPENIEHLVLLDPRVPDFGTVSLIPYDSLEASVAGYGNDLSNTLTGGLAHNVLDGGFGVDTMIGGAGNDIYVVDNAGDIVIEQAREGADTVRSFATYTLSAHVEHLTLLGTASINGTGNALNNEIRGNDASNVLDGGGANDALFGFGGSDTYLFGRGSGRDTVIDAEASDELDTIQFNATVTPGDVDVYRNGLDLELAIHGTMDEVTLLAFFSSSEYDQKQVQFDDGTVWSSTELSTRALSGTVVTGASTSETILGTDGHDLLIGSAGNDVVIGGSGKDTLYGDLAFQPLFGMQVIGDDTLLGGPGNDSLFDFRGNNIFDGGAGNDQLVLGTGSDRVLFGRGSGEDSVTLDNNRTDIDLIEMDAGLAPTDVAMVWHSPSCVDLVILDSEERLTVQLSTDWFAVGPETIQATVRFTDGTQWNLAWSSSNIEIPTATSSDDVLEAAFPGILAGMGGDDTYVLGNSGVSGNYEVIEASGEGTDTVHSRFDYILPANVENLFLSDNFTDVGPFAELAIGNESDNLIVGNTRDNILDGGAGNDVLVGGLFRGFEAGLSETGSDTLIGGVGDDILMADGGNVAFYAVAGIDGRERRDDVVRRADDLFIGGIGNDTYIVQSQEQLVMELAQEGTDTVKSTVSYVLGAHLENLELIALQGMFDDEGNSIPASLDGIGNELNNVLIGSEGENLLSGLAGQDTLAGGGGNDTLQGGGGHDTYLFKIGNAIDTIEDIAIGTDGNRIQFGEGITENDLTFTEDETAHTLTIHVGSNGADKLVLKNFDPTSVNGSTVVETLAFADGTVSNLASLLAVPPNHAPIVATPLADQMVLEDVPFSVQIPENTFTDSDAGDTLLYSASLANGSVLPAWLSFDAVTRIFSGTPNDAQVGSLDLRVTATDTGHLMASEVFTLAVTNVNDAPTVAVPLADQQATEDVPFTIILPESTFTDVDPDDSLTYSATSAGDAVMPTWLSFNPETRTFNGTPRNSDVGTLNIAVKATDLSGLSAMDTFVLAIQNVNDAPTIANPLADQTVQENAPFSMTVPANTFADEDAIHGDRLTYSATKADGTALPTWLTFDASTHTFIGMPNDGEVGSLDLTVTATDSGNLSVSDMFTFTVENVNEAPTVETLLADQSVTQGSVFGFVVPAGTFVDQDTVHGDRLTYNATRADGTALPSWLTFNTTTRTFSGTPQGADIGTLDIRVTATDTGILSASDLFTLTILPMIGTAGSDSLVGTAGDDVIQGLAGDDALQGLAGSDLLDGGAGIDTMAGGLGNDTYVVDTVGDVVTEVANQGIDIVQSSITYTLTANVENLLLIGTTAINGTGNALNNGLIGNSANNTLNGGGGADTMAGGEGNDTYIVNHVGDIVTELADEGIDVVQSSVAYTLGANQENLTLTGSAALNGIGNTLDNMLTGNSATNVLTGGLGNDTYIVGTGDTIVEEMDEGVDTVQTAVAWSLGNNLENITLTGATAVNGTGNTLNNILIGNSAANRLDAGEGNDTLNGGGGADLLIGGVGNDTYIVDNVGDVVTELVDEGTDTVQSTVTYILSANMENLILTGSGAIRATGNNLDNRLLGNSAANILDGATGSDTLIGGSGHDTYVVDNVDDVVIENLNEGTDLVQSTVDYILATNLENLTLIGTSNVNGMGNTQNNILIGNSGNNTLDGDGGADTLRGGLGNDTYVVDNTTDVVTEGLNEGTDLVQSMVTYTLGANIENLTLTGGNAVNGTGNTLNNVLTGNLAANVLNGGAGADTMLGGAGNDTYLVENSGDRIVENVDEGTDLVQSRLSYTLGTNVENLTLTGTGAINGTGNALHNVLTGNSGANSLDGGVGADTMSGGAGNDTYIVDDVGDLVTEAPNQGTDTIQSSVTYTLNANVENLLLTGTVAINGAGNSLNNTITGNNAANQLVGGTGNDMLRGGAGNDTYLVDRGDGQDVIAENDATLGNSDLLMYGATINPLDLVLSRQAGDLRIALHGTTDRMTIQGWYGSPTTARVETIQAGNGQTLVSTQVDQLIQAMAAFTQQFGLSWDQAIDQRPQDVHAVLAASWQS